MAEAKRKLKKIFIGIIGGTLLIIGIIAIPYRSEERRVGKECRL